MTADEPSKLTAETRKAMGITKALPRTVHDAWNFLSADEQLINELGNEFVESFLAVKRVMGLKIVLNLG